MADDGITEFRCPFCKGPTAVVDSRGRGSGTVRRRRRLCQKCKTRITTIEVAVSYLKPKGVETAVSGKEDALNKLRKLEDMVMSLSRDIHKLPAPGMASDRVPPAPDWTDMIDAKEKESAREK